MTSTNGCSEEEEEEEGGREDEEGEEERRACWRSRMSWATSGYLSVMAWKGREGGKERGREGRRGGRNKEYT